MIRLGVTGGIGAGKSIVCRILQSLGVPVFNADQVGRSILNEPEVVQLIVNEFGSGVKHGQGIDRKALADIVFVDPEKLKQLTNIIHPAVRRKFKEFCVQHESEPLVAQEAAVLIESGGLAYVDHLVVVTAPEDIRIRRVMDRDQVSEQDVLQRMDRQLSEKERLEHANSVIMNDGRQLVIPQVLNLYKELSESGALQP